MHVSVPEVHPGILNNSIFYSCDACAYVVGGPNQMIVDVHICARVLVWYVCVCAHIIWVLTNAASLHDIFSSLYSSKSKKMMMMTMLIFVQRFSMENIHPILRLRFLFAPLLVHSITILHPSFRFVQMQYTHIANRMACLLDIFDSNNSNNKMYSVKTDIARNIVRRWTFIVDVDSRGCRFQICNIIVLLSFIRLMISHQAIILVCSFTQYTHWWQIQRTEIHGNCDQNCDETEQKWLRTIEKGTLKMPIPLHLTNDDDNNNAAAAAVHLYRKYMYFNSTRFAGRSPAITTIRCLSLCLLLRIIITSE